MGAIIRDLKKMLRDAGCEIVPTGKVDHEIWFSPINNKHFVVDSGFGLSSFGERRFKTSRTTKSILSWN